MLKGSHSVRVIVLAALVLAVAFSSTVGSLLTGGRVGAATTASKQSRQRAVEQQKLNSAWQAQISSEQAQLQQAQQQQQAQQAATAPSTLTPATPTPAPAPSSVPDIIQAAFAPLGAAAVQWGLCIAQHESGDNPNAVNPSGASGLFQFMPSTFARTPPGQAGGSIWDPTASAQAAAWMYSQGRQAEWETNSMC